MADEPRPQFALEELTFLFRTLAELESPCILMGGQAACDWIQRYLPAEAVLRDLASVAEFLSKDVDFQGDRRAVVTFARRLGTKAEMPGFRDAFGNLMSGKFSVETPKGRLTVEVLRKVPGLDANEVERLNSVEPYGETTVRVLNPIAMLKAKSWNVCHIRKEGRHDAEQFLALLPCVRAYLRGYYRAGETNRTVLRAALKLTEQALRFTELPAGRQTAQKCGVDWSQILPHAYIAASAKPELIRLREKRLPHWLAHIAKYSRANPASDGHRRMLEILASHAKPLCAKPAAPRASRSPHPAARRP